MIDRTGARADHRFPEIVHSRATRAFAVRKRTPPTARRSPLPALNDNLGRRRYRARKRNPRHRCNPRGHCAHVSSRVRDGRSAFVPPDDDGLFVALMWGIIGRAQKRYGVQVVKLTWPETCVSSEDSESRVAGTYWKLAQAA